MDPVSHTIFGWGLVKARVREPLARGAGLALALGALSPDVDLVLMPSGWDRYLAAHEAGTHSLVGATLCGALAAALARVLVRGSVLPRLLTVGITGALSHVAADLLSGAAIRVAWPLTDWRLANLGVMAMGDPYVIVLFAVGGLVMMGWRQRRTQAAIALLTVFAAIAGAKSVLRERVEAAYRAHPTAQRAYSIEPVWGSWRQWRMADRHGDFVRVFTIDAAGVPAVEALFPQTPFEPRAQALVERSRDWENVRHFLRAHEFVFAEVRAAEAGADTTVLWSDVRYCPRDARSVAACAISVGGTIDRNGRAVRLTTRVGTWVQPRGGSGAAAH